MRDVLPEIERPMLADFPERLREWRATVEFTKAADERWQREVCEAEKRGAPAPLPPPLAEAGPEPQAPRLRQNDVTIEKVASLLAMAAPKGLLIVRDELAGWIAEPFTVTADLTPNFQDACLATCVMAQSCRQRVVGQAADMGEVAHDVLGEMTIDHVIELMTQACVPKDQATLSTLTGCGGYVNQRRFDSAKRANRRILARLEQNLFPYLPRDGSRVRSLHQTNALTTAFEDQASERVALSE